MFNFNVKSISSMIYIIANYEYNNYTYDVWDRGFHNVDELKKHISKTWTDEQIKKTYEQIKKG